MKDSCESLRRLRASCDEEAGCPRVVEDLTHRIARNLDVQTTVISILGNERYRYRASGASPPTEVCTAVRICDIFLCMNTDCVTVQDARLDPAFARHPGVVHPPFMRSFAGAQIRIKGSTIATLCVFDSRPDAIRVPHFKDMCHLTEAVVGSVRTRHQLRGHHQHLTRASELLRCRPSGADTNVQSTQRPGPDQMRSPLEPISGEKRVRTAIADNEKPHDLLPVRRQCAVCRRPI